MDRRTLLAAFAAAALSSPARAETPEWQARLIMARPDEGQPTFGFHIKLAKGWKTYWRVPGEAGIPPQIKFESPDVASSRILYPLPQRITDESGEAIGYHDEVVFILKPKLNSGVQGNKLQGKFTAFLGVCQIICKPVHFEADLSSALVDDRVLDRFMTQLPKATPFAGKATQTEKGLELSLSQSVDDIFIDGPDTLYFRKPEFDGKLARFKIDGLQEGQKLNGETLRLTASQHGKGLEQTLVIT